MKPISFAQRAAAFGTLFLLLQPSLMKAQNSSENFPALTIEAEDFKPADKNGWRVVKNGEGNYMVDIIGFQHIFGERLLSADAGSKDAMATAAVTIPAAGSYRVWSRFEQPTGTENRFRVEIRQNGVLKGSGIMGERDAPKYFFGSKTPVGQYDASWGSEGLVEQSFDVQDLQSGQAEISLIAVNQSRLTAPVANRNVDFLFLTQDLKDSWRESKTNRLYPILDVALRAVPTRYYLRLTSPTTQKVTVRHIRNRQAWNENEVSITLEAGVPCEWLPLRGQDVSHFNTMAITGTPKKGLKIRAEFATSPDGQNLLRTIDWDDAQNHELLIALPPYPSKYPGEKILTVEEQYQQVWNYLQAHPSKVGREPQKPLAWGGYIPVAQQGRLSNAAADLYYDIGMRLFMGFTQPANAAGFAPGLEAAKAQFQKRGLALNRSIALGKYRMQPTAKNIADAKKFAEDAGIMPFIQRYDYGDEIAFSEWLSAFKADELQTMFAAWQQKHKGKVEWTVADSSAAAAEKDPRLYVDSLRFYEDASVEYVASQAKGIPEAFGSDVLYGANVAAHPFYYPEIAKYVKWFRPTEDGSYAATFGRHSEYFWQLGQPGPLINSYIADHFRAGMKENPKAMLLQYTMPHSPGNTDASFRRTAFSHLAHGVRGLDYFGIGLNHSFTENYIDFRDSQRYAAIRDINRSMATIEDILPNSTVVPSRIALILSDSTERWDFSGIATDRAGTAVFSEGYKKLRTAYHLDRVGIYYALVHASRSPDLLIESDVQRGDLKNYDVAYWVGDCAEAKTVKALESWVEAGGRLVATAGALRYDQYRQSVDNGLKLLGLDHVETKAESWFFRPQIELPRMKALDWVSSAQTGRWPVIGVNDKARVGSGAQVLATFGEGGAAVVERVHGKGKTTFMAALPGVAYLWSAYQKAGGAAYVPSRGPSSHHDLTGFDETARSWIVGPSLAVLPQVEAQGALVDARLILSPAGYAIPLANYSPDVSKPVTLILRGIPNVKSVTSASAGRLKIKKEKDSALRIEYTPGYGDILRIGQ